MEIEDGQKDILLYLNQDIGKEQMQLRIYLTGVKNLISR
jgi:hypothetical protein